MTNLVGSPLDSSIIAQLAARAQRLSQAGVRAGTDIRYLGQKNAWVRLSSFVNIDSEGAKIISQNVNGEVSIPGGSALSEQWVLKGEVRNTNSLKFGVETGTGAYGTGGIGEIGYRPMPGITGVTVESQPPAGAIRTATVKIKALSLNQLSILDVLYFRLGFSMLLEWGHSIFVSNKGDLINGAIPIDITKVTSKEYVMQQLAQKRVAYSHNYDGMLGLVTNYEWSQAGDGSYDCTLRLSGIGSVIESLKINNQDATAGPKIYPTDVTNAQPTSLPTVLAQTPTFGAFGGVQVPPAPAVTPTGTDANSNSSPASTATLNDSALGIFLSKIQDASGADLLETFFFPSLYAPGLNLLNSPTEGFKYGYSRGYMSGRRNVPETDLTRLKYFLKASILEVENPAQPANTSDGKFIHLSTLLSYMVNSCLLYNNNNNENKPFIYIDFNENTNLCFSLPQQFSVDPKVCLIKPACTDVDYNTLFTSRGIDVAKITDLASPTVGKLATTISSAGDYFDSTRPFTGKFMNILVNVECIKQVMTEVADQDKNIYLGPFLVKLMQKIQLALGNINDFKVGYDDTANTVFIYDNQIVDMQNTLKAIPTLPVFGLTSTVRNYSLKTEASTRIGSMLAITARAGGRNSGTNTDNAAFTGLNKSLYDRLFAGTSTNPKNTATGTEKEKEAPSEGVITLANSFNQQVGTLYEISTGNITYNSSAIDSIKQFYIASMLAIKGNSPAGQIDSVSATGILPLALDISLDGIGGIPLYQAFTLPANRLPAQYVDKGRPRIGFTVAGLSHQIENNEWVTNIRGLMINIPSNRRVYTPDYTKNPNTTVNSNDQPITSVQTSPTINTTNRGCAATVPLVNQNTATPTSYTDKFPKIRAGIKLNNIQSKNQKYIYEEYLAEIENNPAVFQSIGKGLKCLMTGQAIHEGFYPGARAYRYKNPGNIGNTDNGKNKNLSPLAQGILAQATYIREAADPSRKKGHHAYVRYNQPNYYSPELNQCVPGFDFNYTGTLGQYLLIYATAARISNSYLSGIMGFFKYNGLTVNGNTRLVDIIAMT